MLLRFDIHVVYEDGRSFDVTTNARDQFALEEQFDGSILDLIPATLLRQIGITPNGAGPQLPEGLTVADARVQTRRYGWLAWHALHRTGQVVEDFDGFCDQLVELDTKGLRQAVPTRPAPAGGSQPN